MPNFTTSDGISLHYRDSGPENGRPVLFLPGWGGSTRYFDRQFDLLSSELRLLGLDFRGQGASEKTAQGQRIARWAHDLNEFLASLDLHDVVLVGWSFGGTTALYHADLFGSERVAKIVLIGPGVCQLNHGEWRLGGFELAAADQLRTAIEASFEDTVRTIVPTFFHNHLPHDTLGALIEETLRCAPPAGAASVFWDGVCQDLRDTLPRVRRPVLVVLGRHDSLVSPDTASLFSVLPEGRVEIFEHSGHSPFLEEAERFAATLNDFAKN
ncbi:alpha/beta fold hydrolase [Sciscionella sediminilitoris]|uniref:alpha/beta fold hydrolase n=1 Tax=Sciscionella sediminilitoris TaxID=1445613 RepID=UPI0018D1926E|nr:alpha/beta hydrolase [Sciscionella sp. SE31]